MGKEVWSVILTSFVSIYSITPSLPNSKVLLPEDDKLVKISDIFDKLFNKLSTVFS